MKDNYIMTCTPCIFEQCLNHILKETNIVSVFLSFYGTICLTKVFLTIMWDQSTIFIHTFQKWLAPTIINHKAPLKIFTGILHEHLIVFHDEEKNISFGPFNSMFGLVMSKTVVTKIGGNIGSGNGSLLLDGTVPAITRTNVAVRNVLNYFHESEFPAGTQFKIMKRVSTFTISAN